MVSIRDSSIQKNHSHVLKIIYNFDLASLIVLIISWAAWDYFYSISSYTSVLVQIMLAISTKIKIMHEEAAQSSTD